MFTVDPEGKLTPENIRSIGDVRKARAGLPWEAQFPDLINYDGVAWYWRSFRIPEAEFPSKLTIWARLLDEHGRETCRNYQEILVLPYQSVRSSGKISVFGADESVMKKIREIGLTIVKPSEVSVAVPLGVNKDAIVFAEKDGRVLFLLEDCEAGPPYQAESGL
ncbi:MAG: hypothetical protein QXJ23_10435 [Thermofilum sp.]|uniref:hypothetical protein n=1 Tax=Thermofilum sp. TaxID=1961369 RepID=UPI0031620C13